MEATLKGQHWARFLAFAGDQRGEDGGLKRNALDGKPDPDGDEISNDSRLD